LYHARIGPSKRRAISFLQFAHDRVSDIHSSHTQVQT
jgi:hypothetical protein